MSLLTDLLKYSCFFIFATSLLERQFSSWLTKKYMKLKMKIKLSSMEGFIISQKVLSYLDRLNLPHLSGLPHLDP